MTELEEMTELCKRYSDKKGEVHYIRHCGDGTGGLRCGNTGRDATEWDKPADALPTLRRLLDPPPTKAEVLAIVDNWQAMLHRIHGG